MFHSQEISSGLISVRVIFDALQSIQIHFSFAEFKNPKNFGIQPIYAINFLFLFEPLFNELVTLEEKI